MRRRLLFLATALLLISTAAYGQTLPEGWTTHVNAKFYGFENPLVLSRKVEKPGMSAKEIYKTIIAAKRESEWLSDNLGNSIDYFGLNEIESAFKIYHLEDRRFYYKFYIDAFYGYYTVHLTDINISSPRLYVCGSNGHVFRDIYSPRNYRLAVKLAERAAADFEVICKKIEDEAFSMRLTETSM